MKPALSDPPPPMKTLLGRGWRKKCPHCGKGELYRGWLKFHEHCPVCGLRYLTNEGDLLGALFFLDRALFLIPFIVLFYFHIWHPNTALFIISGVVMLYLLVFTMPNRNGVTLAFDYYIRRSNDDISEDDFKAPEKK